MTHDARPLSALDVIFTRRSVRSYTTQPMERTTIRSLLDAAVQAPTAMHEQRWAFAVVQDPALLSRLSDRAKAWLRGAEPVRSTHATDAESLLHGEFVKRLADPGFNIFYNAPALVVVCTRGTETFVMADAWLAAENFMLAACALGLGTCCIGAAVGALNTSEGKLDLGIPPDVTAVVPIVVGVPSGTADPASRREPEVLSWK